ncbi:DUF1735 domain-containing protein [Niabella sp. CC-SYL272]|uniref:DUF1735 domain-containing protein n=1 Tax=Niabella agricola TaxID=2891571 RepID=UPI001F341AD1|nr:DUF1735 domain-containing protein [Niabella agricola]MCF3111868.1 DUF1735 domain-containing protein [Niabella agricola]
MKKYFAVYIAGLLLLPVLLISCLKDDSYDSGAYQAVRDREGIKVISLGLATTSSDDFASVAFDNSNNDTIVNLVPVELGGTSNAQEDIHVTVEQDNSLVTKYNEEHEEEYLVPNNVTIVNPVVIIPKGGRVGFLQVKFKPSNLIGISYALGFKIKSVSEAGYNIGNYNSGVAAIVIKNKYDGVYLASGVFTHPTLGGNFSNKEWKMITTSANALQFQLNTTALFSVVVDVEIKADNKLAITSSSVVLTPYDPAKNYYDPATRTFHMEFGYSGNTRYMVATAVYNRPR